MLFARKRNPLIVVIEDESGIRHMIASVLSELGFEVKTAEDGRVGIKLVVEHRPDLVICDIAMPDVDGFQVLTSLRGHPDHAGTPILMCTAMSQMKNIERGSALGATGFILKPIDLPRLEQQVTELLGPLKP